MAPRFYVDCDFQPDSTLVLPEKPAHHASRVLRMREGDSAVLFDGRGNEAQCILHFFSDRTEANILSVAPSHTESLKNRINSSPSISRKIGLDFGESDRTRRIQIGYCSC